MLKIDFNHDWKVAGCDVRYRKRDGKADYIRGGM